MIMDRRFEREAKSVFVPLGDEPGPATPLTEAEKNALVQAAVRRARPRRSASPSRPRRALWQTAAAVTLALTALGAAAAAVRTFFSPAPAVEIAPRVHAPEVTTTSREPASRESAVPEPAVAPEATAAVEVGGDAERSIAPAASSASRERVRARDLLREANGLRAKGYYARAERVYASVARSATEAGDVEAATIAAAELRLEQLNDPSGALASYRDTLARRPAGILAEEARYGLARCHRALGNADAERAALKAFLARHPNSVLAIEATGRLRALEVE